MLTNKTTFVFIRHGQGTHNIDYEKYGEHAYFDESNINAKLTEVGRNQAIGVCNSGKLGKIDDYDYIFCSPLSRCINTLMLAFPESQQNKVYLDDRLMEPQGDCACNKRQEYDELITTLPDSWDFSGVGQTNPFNYLKEGYQLGLSGNSIFLKRVKEWGDEILEKYRGSRILVCSHHDFIRGWFQVFQEGKLVSPKNCEILYAECF